MSAVDERTVWLAVWAALAVAVLAWTWVTARSDRLPGLGEVVRRVRRRALGDVLLVAGWAWVGWHLFVRTTP
jgi:hypothetical protein